MKKAFITGITGQDGSYLTELLLNKKYEVHGLVQKSVTSATSHFQVLSLDEHYDVNQVTIHYGDICDYPSLIKILQEIQPDEVYHLAAQSDRQISFVSPLETADVNALGSLRVFSAVHDSKCDAKIFNASSRELFGSSPSQCPQNEYTKFNPDSPYAIAKLFAYYCAIYYREKYGMKIWNGILYNHESPRRGKNFITRKITRGVAKILSGKQEKLMVGNLDSVRDWGYAPDYVEAMWMMLQSKRPDDFIVATGTGHTIREYIFYAFSHAGISLEWIGKDLNERGIEKKTNKTLIYCSPELYKLKEKMSLIGDSSKAQKILKWKPKTDFKTLIQKMVDADLKMEGII
ncbi:MAG TPA: GDP-mannose 4,6-dehydratase [Thermoplasmata archaeon]|jgi:GDPmannose 4,6-dehydratase|nr:MAG TPA: GDP-mannose 4,6-dehydratase [Thermoplasmata archaeon]